MKMPLLLISLTYLLCHLVLQSAGQIALIPKDTIVERYNRSAIYYNNTWQYFKNNSAYPVGFFASKLKKEFKGMPEAKAEFDLYRRDQNTGLLLSLFSLAAVGTGVALYENNRQLAGGLFLGGLAGSLVAVRFQLSSSRHLHKSIYIHNREVLLKEML